MNKSSRDNLEIKDVNKSKTNMIIGVEEMSKSCIYNPQDQVEVQIILEVSKKDL